MDESLLWLLGGGLLLYLLVNNSSASVVTFNATGTAADLADTVSVTPNSTASTSGSGTTRGEINNNPGNLVYNANVTWQGQTGEDGGGYLTFDTYQDGIRAIAVLLGTYFNTYGLNTATGIISRYAPPSGGNPTQNYINYFASALGVGVNSAIDLTNPTTMATAISAIISFENGENIYDPGTIASIASANVA
jgi:hypothetical protein